MVTTWILILSFLATDYHGSSAITTAGPFASRDECVHAGNLWLSQANRVTDRTWIMPTATCVQTTALAETVTYGSRE